MHTYDDATVEAAAGAFCHALSHVEGTWEGAPITPEGANLAMAIGVTTSAAHGETGRVDMLVSALNHVAVAYGEHSKGIDAERLPAIRTAEYYALHAEVLRAMARTLRDDACSAALERCGKAFDRIARSQELVAASLPCLCKDVDGKWTECGS